VKDRNSISNPLIGQPIENEFAGGKRDSLDFTQTLLFRWPQGFCNPPKFLL
jgi:hypothetical protein